jgi:glutamate 5-kinase
VRGTIVIGNNAGRALRKAPRVVYAADVLDCAGGFCTADPVYIAFRTLDGSQYVVATGVVRCDEAALRQAIASGSSAHDASARTGDADIVVQEQDVQLLWPPPKSG